MTKVAAEEGEAEEEEAAGYRIKNKTPHKDVGKNKVDAKCHACHAKLSGVTRDQERPSAPPEPAQCHKCCVKDGV